MNSSYNKILSAVGVSLLSAALLASCSEWTEPEPVSFEYATLEQKNPELYQAYMESLRAYRFSEHKVLIAKFDNRKEAPAGRADHINCLPDSVDYVILTNPSEMNSQTLIEISELQQDKKTPVLGQLDISYFLKEYKIYKESQEDANSSKSDGEEEKIIDFTSYLNEQVPNMMEAFNEYPFDGVNIVYNGRNPSSCTEEMMETLKSEQIAFFTPIIEWLKSKKDGILFIEGTPQYILLEGNIVDDAKYILLPTQSAMTDYEFSHIANLTLSEGNLPTDRVIPVVSTISLTDPNLLDGHFTGHNSDGTEMTAIQGAAYWVNCSYKELIPRGIAVEHSQNDYYNLRKVYSVIRSAIEIMNPSPIK